MAKRRPSGDGMLRKREDGRWESRLVVGHKENGSPIYKCFLAKTQKEVLVRANQYREALRVGSICEDYRITLGEWLDRWMAQYMTYRLRASTIRGYRRYIDTHIKPAIGKKRISAVTTADVQKMYNRLKKEGGKGGKELSGSTVRSIHRVLHGAMDTAVHEHLIVKNPTDGVTLPKAVTPTMKVLNDSQVEAFLEAIRGNELWYDFFYTALMTGLRKGEICGLKWADFESDTGKLKIRRTVSRGDDGLYENETKTENGMRTILLPRTVAEVLKKRKETAVSEWIFPNPLHPEQPVNPSSAYTQLKKILKTASLPSIRFHDLRHTFATMALENGVDIKTVAEILGHSTAETALNTYTHITEDMQRTAAERIDRKIARVEPKTEGRTSTATSQQKPPVKPFEPYKGKKRKPGTGYIKQLSQNCWQGRCTPTVDCKRVAMNVYGKTREECEGKLQDKIRQATTEKN